MSEAARERITLSREFSAFLVELSIALHKHAMYPSGHPSLDPAAEAVARRAGRLLEDRPMVALGVARRQLIIEGVATDPSQPVLRRLAETLHGHHLGAVSLLRGIEPEEIGAAFRLLAGDAEQDGPIGLRPAGSLPNWPHLRLHPLTFDRLTLVTDARDESGGSGTNSWHGAELWIGLARAALAGEGSGPQAADADEEVPIEPAVVARAIDEHARAEAYDQVIVGYLLQIARELKDAGDAETAALRRRTARLIAALNPRTLRRLVDMGGDALQRRAFVLDATHGMTVDAVLDIVRAVGDVSGQTISDGLVRMLTKLATHAEMGTDQARPLADAALREQVEQLIGGWHLADPNPEAYARLLERITVRTPVDPVLPDTIERSDRPDSLRMAQMSLELGASGPMVDRAIDGLLQEGRLAGLLDHLSALPEGAGATADAALARIMSPRAVRLLLEHEPIDFDSLDRLLPKLPPDAFNLLLDRLSSTESRTTRRKLLDRLSQVEQNITSLITSRLYDDWWFVQRNMLMLLERSGRAPEGFSATPWATHADPRVRHQALRLQFTLPHERDEALRAALTDPDARMVGMALVALQQDCPPELVNLVTAIAEETTVEEAHRLLAIHALGRCRARESLYTLLRMADGGRSLFGRQRLPPPTPCLVATVRALAVGWTADARAASVLALARQSPDPDVRSAAEVGA